MKRFLLRVAPVALMAYPLYVYRAHWPGLNESLEWRQHTYEARSLAERIARDAGGDPDPGRLRADLDEFARTTADNPAQVARVGQIRRALDPFDPRAVARLAEAAIAEEDRLLPGRARTAIRQLDETRRLADRVYLFGMAILVMQAFVEFFIRATEPARRRGGAR